MANRMNYNAPFILGKIYNNEKYAMDLLNGTLYINPLALFGVGNLATKKEVPNGYRDDLNEGLLININISNMKLDNRVITFFQDIGGIPQNTSDVGEIDSRFLYENVYCLSALFYDLEKKELLKMNKKLSQFTDKNKGLAIVIYDVKKFLKRIMLTLSESLGSMYWAAYGLVNYDFDKHSTVETDEFTKEQDFSYQQEFRIAINIGHSFRICKNTNKLKYDLDKSVLMIDIGSIEDIAFTLPVEDYINLDFPDRYKWVKYMQPEKICTFYPPLKNEISYIYPLMRIENMILISENAMYPIIRELNKFSINYKQLKKTLALEPEKDTFFLTILESYFLRILDIYKSNKEPLNPILTAMMYYMVELNISQCAGICLKIEDGVLTASYEDMCIHDSNLIDESYYKVVQKKTLEPKPTDFAVLLSLSEQVNFEEYEYDGEKYVRVEVSKDGILPSGMVVKKGEAVWVKVSKINFIGY